MPPTPSDCSSSSHGVSVRRGRPRSPPSMYVAPELSPSAKGPKPLLPPKPKKPSTKSQRKAVASPSPSSPRRAPDHHFSSPWSNHTSEDSRSSKKSRRITMHSGSTGTSILSGFSNVVHRKMSAASSKSNPDSVSEESAERELPPRTTAPWEYAPPPKERVEDRRIQTGFGPTVYVSSHRPNITINTRMPMSADSTPLGSPISSVSSPTTFSPTQTSPPGATSLSPAPAHLRSARQNKVYHNYKRPRSPVQDFVDTESKASLEERLVPAAYRSPRATQVGLLGVHALGGQKKEVRQGYSGDWNQQDMSDVISRLRSLK